jgi:ComF family protein
MADMARLAGHLAGRLLDLALPPRCAGCGIEGEALCRACRRQLDARLEEPPGQPIGVPVAHPPSLAQVEWCAPYGGAVRAALHALKYGGERRLAAPLGEALARRWTRAAAGGDIVVGVPVHADRLLERGYDQAVLIAEAAAPLLRLPSSRLVERHRATARQFDLDRDHRARNVAGAFRLREGARRFVEGRWIVLVDDVMTTGATLEACARALLDGGAMAVSAISVARER